jgi:multidrug efflux pump
LLTLYTTPVVYLYLDRLQKRLHPTQPDLTTQPDPPRAVAAE